MPANEAEEMLALALIFVVHVAGGLMLVWGMLDGDTRPALWRRRGGGGGGPEDPPRDPAPPSPPGARAMRPLPLPGARRASARLRDETPLRDAYERPARRPQPVPDRSPARRV